MKRKRFKEEQIIGILKEAEAGVAVQDLVRKYGVSEQTYYRPKRLSFTQRARPRDVTGRRRMRKTP
jgi:hypothetical protein